MVTYAKFINLFPEFTEVNESYVETWLDATKLKLSEKVFGELYELAVYYLLAHTVSTLKVLQLNEGVDKGFITSESIGDVSVSYSSVSTGSAELDNYVSTAYGREYLAIRKKKVIAATAVRS